MTSGDFVKGGDKWESCERRGGASQNCVKGGDKRELCGRGRQVKIARKVVGEQGLRRRGNKWRFAWRRLTGEESTMATVKRNVLPRTLMYSGTEALKPPNARSNRLQLPQFFVQANIIFQQLFVGSFFDDFAFIQNNNSIQMLQSRKSVGDGD